MSKGTNSCIESLSVENAKDKLIDILYNQVIDLTAMSKIELGDDVIKEVNKLQNIINNKSAMNNKHKIVSKGYTLTVVSWENDGDYYNTQSITVQTLEEAKVWYEMMQLCKSKNSRSKDIVYLGNTYEEFSNAQINVIKDFITNNLEILVPGENIESFEDQDDFVDCFRDLSGRLLGYSEYFACRVMESCIVTYSDEDIYVETLNLENEQTR